jgi:hypothetical protein
LNSAQRGNSSNSGSRNVRRQFGDAIIGKPLKEMLEHERAALRKIAIAYRFRRIPKWRLRVYAC